MSLLLDKPVYEPYNPSGEDVKIIEFIARRKNTMAEARQRELEAMEIDEMDVWGDLVVPAEQRPANDWRTHVRNPLAFLVIRQKVAEMLQQVPEAVFKHASGLDDGGNEIAQRRLELFKIIFRANQNNMDHITQLTYSFIDMLALRKGFLETSYITRYKDVKIPKIYKGNKSDVRQVDEAGHQEYITETILEADGAPIISRHPKDVLLDEMYQEVWNPSGINCARDCILRDVMDIDTFRERYKGWDNYMSVIPGSKDSMNYADYDIPKEQDWMKTGKQVVSVDRYYNAREDVYMAVANGVLVRNAPIPFNHKQLPIAEIKAFPLPHTSDSISDTSLLRAVSDKKNIIDGLSFDAAKLNITPTVFFMGLDADEIQWGGVNELDGGIDLRQQLQFAPTPGLSDSFERMESKLDTDITRISGVDINVLTVAPQEKAFQTKIKKDLSNRILSLTQRFNEGHGLKHMYFQVMSNLMEYFPRKIARNKLLPDGTISKVSGFPKVKIEGMTAKKTNFKQSGRDLELIELTESEDAFSIIEGRPEYIRTQLDVAIFAGSMQKELEVLDRQLYNEYVQLITQIAQLDPTVLQSLDIAELIKKLSEKYGENIEDITKEATKTQKPKYISNVEFERVSLMAGKTPILPDTIDHEKHVEYITQFQGTKTYKLLSADIKNKFKEAKFNHIQAIGSGQLQPSLEAEAAQKAQMPQPNAQQPGQAISSKPLNMGADVEKQTEDSVASVSGRLAAASKK